MSDDTNDDEFQDPLSNFEPKSYDDPLEEALAETTVAEIRHTPHSSIAPDKTVLEAIQQLAEQQVACLLVEENGELLGVFTERDVLNKIALEPERRSATVREFMEPNPVYVYRVDPTAAALCVMAVCGHRHVPVVDVNEKVVGIVGPHRVSTFLSQHLAKK